MQDWEIRRSKMQTLAALKEYLDGQRWPSAEQVLAIFERLGWQLTDL